MSDEQQQQQQQQQPVMTISRAPAEPPRETIRVAFHDSNYATPATDHTIPGNHSHYPLPPRLGRAYAEPRSNVNSALIAPGAAGVTAAEEAAAAAAVAAARGEALAATQPLGPHHSRGADDRDAGITNAGTERRCLRASENFILNSKNGGRRHFDEPRSGEASWRPQRRPEMDFGFDKNHEQRPVGKGRGIFNMDNAYSMHPEADEALQRREALRARTEAGRALVPCPEGHTAEELGLYVPRQFGTGGASGGSSPAVPADADGSGTANVLVVTRPTAAGSSSGTAGSEKVASSVHQWGVPGAAGNVDPLTAAPARKGVFDVASSRRVEKAALDLFRDSRRSETAALNRRDDVEAVRRLPDI